MGSECQFCKLGRLERERDEAIKRASDATIECGRLEERLENTERERDEARAALREMVDAAHTSFAASYPLARRMRERFNWLGSCDTEGDD